MEGASGGRDPENSRHGTANDRLKAGWPDRLGWSTVAAVAIHAALFLLWPSWESPERPADAELVPDPVQWIGLHRAALQGGGEPAPVPAGVDDDSLPPGSDSRAGADLHAGELTGLSDALLDRLRRRPSFRPTLAEPPPPSPEEESDGPPADGEDADALTRDAATAELASLPESGPLDMDRLSSLQPRLALTSVSDWVLVRNPREVVEFIHETYRRGELSPDASGLVSVTLWIDRTGTVEWSEIKQSSGRRDIDDLALKLFTEIASFRPALEEGVPVARSVIFILAFPWM